MRTSNAARMMMLAAGMFFTACGSPHHPHEADAPSAHVSTHLGMANDVDGRALAPHTAYGLTLTVSFTSPDGSAHDLDLLLDVVRGKTASWQLTDADGKRVPLSLDGRGYVVHLFAVPGDGSNVTVPLTVVTPDVAPLGLELVTTVVSSDDNPQVLFEDPAHTELMVAAR